ncbi:SPOR domain-containing protein [Candidatus Poribacteria bacterium]
MQKQKNKPLKIGRIFLALIAAALVLTVVFEIGVWVGKKRIIEAEQAVAQRNDLPFRSTAPASDEEDSPADSSPEQAEEERKPARQTETSVRATLKIPTGGEFPAIPSQNQSTEQPQAGGEAAQYTVQVGTFGSQQNAEKLVALLKSYEYRSWLRPEPSAENMLYSVFVGGFNTRDEAKQFGSFLQARLSFVTSYMVREIQE